MLRFSFLSLVGLTVSHWELKVLGVSIVAS
jgi:hypothetical protein